MASAVWRQAMIDQSSPPAAKIALFRSLFRGRTGVYPRRVESRKIGKSEYAPACANEWVRGLCEKPRIKCADCSHRRFLPVTNVTVSLTTPFLPSGNDSSIRWRRCSRARFSSLMRRIGSIPN